ncbi:hypothetical protein [Methylotetracoccus oryzae]|nr:hypothetical protein [Methylotetracoccus oryzae]
MTLGIVLLEVIARLRAHHLLASILMRTLQSNENIAFFAPAQRLCPPA